MRLIIANQNYSSWSLRPWFLLKIFNIPFEEIKLPLFTEEFEQRIGQLSPSRKVPALHDRDCVVWDSLAICEYINEAHCNGQAWPHDIALRAHARAISAEMHSGFPNIRSQMPMDCKRAPKAIEHSEALTKELERVDHIWTQCREANQTKGPWLFGTPSIADALYAPLAIRFNSYAISNLSNIAQEYIQFLLSHPSMKEWIKAGQSESATIEWN
jgi:glutathione S-transferase